MLNNIKVEYLGKKGKITEALQGLKDVPSDQRREYGIAINEFKQEVTAKLQETEAMRLQNAFADGVRGLQVCGVKTLRDDAVVKCTRA